MTIGPANTPADHDAIVSAFTVDQAARLTGLTRHQLEQWDRDGFFRPSMADENKRRPFSRIYSFNDVLSLRGLSILRNDLKLDLAHLIEVGQRLAHLGQDAWHRTTLYVVQKKVVFFDPYMDPSREIVSGQGVLKIPLETVRETAQRVMAELLARDPGAFGEVSKRRSVAHNADVVSGTRIPVRAIQSFADDGYSVDDILKEYPALTKADVEAAINHGRAA